MFFWRRKKPIAVVPESGVSAGLHETHNKIDEANDATLKLNRLLRANGITLKIHIASGGQHGR